MDSPAHGRSSNSPNAKISSLTIEGTTGNVLRARLDDGSLFLFDIDHPAASGLTVGLDVDEPLRLSLEAASNAYRCRRKALDLLARSEQCRRGLEMKLRKREFDPFTISEALDRLEATGALDDRRFAEWWVRSRLRSHPEGSMRLQAGLASKGVSMPVARAAVETVLEDLDDSDGLEALKRAWRKLSKRSTMNDDRLLQALVRRGFPVKQIRLLMQEQTRLSEDD